MNDKLQQAITAIKSGDKVTGQELLVQVIKADPSNETAWMWMTVVLDDPQKKKQCLQKVLQINPNNAMAKKGLAQLESTLPLDLPKPEPMEMPKFQEIVPPQPPSLTPTPHSVESTLPPAQREPTKTSSQPVKSNKPIQRSPQKQKSIPMAAKDLRAGSGQKPASAWNCPMILAGGIIGLFLLCVMFALLPAIFLSGGSPPKAKQAIEENKSTAQAAPASTPLPSIVFADKDYPDIESLVKGVIGSRLKTSNFEFYSDSPGRKGYDVDVTVASPETRTRMEMLQIAYTIAHEFYYSFADKQPDFLTLHLRSSEDTSDCVFGLGVGYRVTSEYIPANRPDDLEKWFNNLVRAKNYGDLPGQSESSMAYGNDPTSKPNCNLKHWKK